jgi:hypothetical protein
MTPEQKIIQGLERFADALEAGPSMTPDLRAAVERLQRGHYDFKDVKLLANWAAERILADDDDDAPITKEFLRGRNWTCSLDGVLWWHTNEVGQVGFNSVKDGVFWRLTNGSAWFAMQTRGQLRRLLAALNPKENNDG